MEKQKEIKKEEGFLKKLNLQLFAEGGEGGAGSEGSEGGAGSEGSEGGVDDDKGGSDEGKKDKTYTQDELNSIAKKEKESGKKAILKELGFEDVKTVKDGLAKFKEWQDNQKTDAEKAATALKEKEDAVNSANEKLALANAKIEAIKVGVNPKFVDDVIVLAMAKISDDKDLSVVLEEMKKTYPTFFSETEDDDSDKGTGSKVGGKKKKIEAEGIGERLAKRNQTATGTEKKSSYFGK